MNNNVRLAAFFVVSLMVWFGSGFLISPKSDEVQQSAPAPLTVVQVTQYSEQLFRPKLTLRAHTESNRTVNVLAQMAGQISKILVAEGALVSKGDAICQINAEDRYLRLDQAKANLEQSDISYRGALKLKTGGYQSDLAISQANANLAAARANLKRAQLNVDNLQVTAPFAGIVENRPVEVGDYVVQGSLCASVVELHPIKIKALVSEKDINRIDMGSLATVTLGDGQTVSATVTYLAHEANTTTRSYRLEATASNVDRSIRAGLSSRLDILLNGANAHLIPASSVLLNDLGQTVVRVLLEGNLVDSVKVSSLGEARDGIWVSGLPSKVSVITVGQHYIIDGESVDPTFIAAEAN